MQSLQPGSQDATWQVVPLHAGVPWAAEQPAPQAPQLATLLKIATSQPSSGLPLQLANPAAHDIEQRPDAQDATPLVVLQAWPHPPQWSALVWVLTSQPLSATVSQSANPVLQAPRVHVPPEHCAAAFGKLQTLPQLPQLDAVVVRSTSQPSV